jgi:3-oxoacyl-[acyl-carrier-protein] synthase-1
MTSALLIAGCGAVTAVGLTAEQTCAAMRARLSGFERVSLLPPPAEPVCVGQVPAARRLKRSPTEWLVNMAALALRECLDSLPVHSHRVALLLALPDSHRAHPGMEGLSGEAILQAVQRRVQRRMHPLSQVLDDGHASAFRGLASARQLLSLSDVEACVVGGVDSLVNQVDVERLRAGHRLHDETNPQGVIPAEGAAFVAVTRQGWSTPTLAQVVGVGIAQEQDTILGERFSTGLALVEALEAASKDAGCAEPLLSFRVSDMNGERYRSWESLLASTRFYRTRREHMSVNYAASSVGDVGVAAGALGLIAAATSIHRGHASGPWGVCEASSDNGLRAACIVGPAPGAPSPPFRSRTAWERSAAVRE